MIVIRFTTRWGIYNGGEVAGFAPETARELVEAGVAEYYEQVAEVAEVAEAADEAASAAASTRRKRATGRR